MPRFVQVLVVLSLAPAHAGANDASYGGDAATVFALKEDRVRMVRERVLIRASDRRSPGFGNLWEADCTFELENLAKTQVEIQVGFPDWLEWGDGPSESQQWAIKDFRVEVDGQAVEAVHRDVSPRKTGKFHHEGAWVFPVTIQASGRVLIRNTYSFGGFWSMGPYSVCAGERPHRAARRAFWRNAPRTKLGADFEEGVCDVVTYVVTTARTWAGPVGEAVVTIELPPDTLPHLFVPVPEATEVRGLSVTWRFRNWRPSRELSVIRVRPIPFEDTPVGFASAAQARAFVSFAKANGFDEATVHSVAEWFEKSYPGASTGEVRHILDVLRAFDQTVRRPPKWP